MAASLIAIALLASCTGGTTAGEEPTPSRGAVGGTLRLGMSFGSFYGMDPRDEWSATTWELFRCCLVRTLMSYDVSGVTRDLRPVPDLAVSPPEISADGLTWTFQIRPGIRYAPPLEDVEITSADFVRAITRAATSFDAARPAATLAGYFDLIDGFVDYAKGNASSIVGLQTPDPFTLRIVTTRADARLLYLLALPMSAPIPPAPGDPDRPLGVATGYDHPEGFGRVGYGGVMVASGPYMFEGAEEVDDSLPAKDREPASGLTPWRIGPEEDYPTLKFGSMTLVRNPSWRPEDDPLRLALPDRIELVGAEAKDLFRSMEKGDLDLVFDDVPPPPVLERYQDDPSLRPLIQTTTGSVFSWFASFNLALPPFDDVAVRRAVAAAMDRAAMAEAMDPLAHVAQHFASDTTEASLLASWSTIPGPDGRGDMTAAREAMAASRYATGNRCTDPACGGVQIVMRDTMQRALPELKDRLRTLGIEAEITIDANPYACLDPEERIGMCIGLGWAPDYPSADNYLGAFFASDGQLPTTRMGATPKQLRGWGYDLTEVPTVDGQVERCRQEIGANQAPCWARIDQYVVSQLMPAVPIAEISPLRLSSPRISTLPWDQIYLEPALDRIVANADAG